MKSYTEFSVFELKKATDNYSKSLMIGEGGYGIVYRGFLRYTTVAIKVLKCEGSQEDNEFNLEVRILTNTRHPNLISFIGANSEAWSLVFEFLPNGSLDTFLTNGKNTTRNLSWQDRIRIASEICSELIFLHSMQPHGIAHGDLKPENILLDSNLVSKLTDFGISRELQRDIRTITPFHFTQNPKGSIGYFDPEYYSTGELTPQSDVFLFGAILLQLVTGRSHPRGIKRFVEGTINDGKFDTIIDNSWGQWPIDEAKKMASLGLWCNHEERRKRPSLGTDVWPSLESMMRVAVGFKRAGWQQIPSSVE
ncbi:hypothetical protein LUZ60_010063 [Juncus effusus]|nr:hypothetical protein LUZ60_010063 [Juncus effusus]